MESRQKEEGFSCEELIKLEIKKCCSDCKTTKTPLWRSGPSGPKSLCNACGIRLRKKRHTPAGAKNDGNKKGKSLKLRNVLKMNVMPLMEGKRSGERSLSLSPSPSPRQWGEVERAALLLMALSCGAVFA